MSEFDLLIPTAFLLGLATFARKSQRSWFAPGAYFTLVWTVQVLLSFVVPEYVVWSGAIWWILLTCLVLYLGSVAGRVIEGSVRTGRQRNVTMRNYINFQRPVAILGVSFLAGMSYTVLVRWSGIELSIDRPPLAYQLLLPFHFAGPLLGGMIFASGSFQGGRVWLTFLSLVPPASLAILFTGRTALIAPILFFIAGYLVVQIHVKRGILPLIGMRRILWGLIILSLFVAIGTGIYMLRIVRESGLSFKEEVAAYSNAFSREALLWSWATVKPAVFGHVYSFSYYFVDAWRHPPEPHWGSIIFAAPLDFLGLGGERYPWEEFEIDRGVFSNIYTMLRAPMDDFGFWGALLWWLAIGMVQGWAYERVRRGSILPCVLVSWFYVDVTIIGGFFFRYNAIILSYMLVGLYLFWSRRVTRRYIVAGKNEKNRTLAPECREACL